MRGWGFAIGLGCALAASTASGVAYAEEPKKKSAEEEIEESKATLAASHAESAPPLERGAPYKPSVMPWILGGVGIAGIVTGGIFVLVSLSDESKADDFEKLARVRTNENERNDLLAQAERSNDASQTNMTIGLVAGGAGLALLGAGIVWAIVDGPPKDAKTARLRPAMRPGVAYLTCAF